jgi:hypothetical protein
MPRIINYLQMARIIIAFFNEFKNLLVGFGMAIAIRDPPNLSLEVVSVLKDSG